MLSDPPFSLLDNLNAVDDAIDQNAEIAEEILARGLEAFGLSIDPPKDSVNDWKGTAKPHDIAKAHSTIRQFYRDWSNEGYAERRVCNDIALQDLKCTLNRPLPHHISSEAAPKVLVPGAGLGRLVFDLALAGYNAEGNELSYHQLLASNWILNNAHAKMAYALFPFASMFSNVVSRKDQLRRMLIPDVHPGEASAAAAAQGSLVGRMDMTAADFVVLYGDAAQRETFDAVVTVFFIDTAPNLIRYIKTIHNCLKPGGVFINVGPLLWHFDDRVPNLNSNKDEGVVGKDSSEDQGIGEPGSFELTNEEVLLLVEKLGFHIEKQEILNRGLGYIQNPQSMIQNMYRVSHWIARKQL
jgi:carnosine N-methyltransferase